VKIRWLAFAALAAAGCDDAPSIALEDLNAETIRARCERLVRCGLLATEETCTAFFRTPDEDNLHAAIDAGKIHYDGEAAHRCLEALAALPCDETSREVRIPVEACEQMLAGTLEVGDPCAFDRECRSGSCDAPVCPSDSCCTGSCLATRVAAIGAPCTTDEECVGEAFCSRQGLCSPLAARGQPCRLDAHCDHGLACIGATELEDGACRALPLLGESCPYGRCAELGATCSDAGLCVPTSLPGAPCATGSDCSPFSVCGPGGVCIDVPRLGERCDFECAGEAWCSNGTCIAPLENTTPCSADNQCASLYCQEGVVFESCADRPICF
jgi:hypothetical protein